MVPSALFGSKAAPTPPSEPAEVSVPVAELTEATRRGIKTFGYPDTLNPTPYTLIPIP